MTKQIRRTTLFALTILLAAGTGPLGADTVTIGGHGDLSLNRPFCGT